MFECDCYCLVYIYIPGRSLLLNQPLCGMVAYIATRPQKISAIDNNGIVIDTLFMVYLLCKELTTKIVVAIAI